MICGPAEDVFLVVRILVLQDEILNGKVIDFSRRGSPLYGLDQEHIRCMPHLCFITQRKLSFAQIF
jgi:hypothetical protein